MILPAHPQPCPTLAPGQSLLLAAHGCRSEPWPRMLARSLAARLATSGPFTDVRCAFWKEPVFLHEAFAHVHTELVYVVPLFLADGYYTRTVVPRELALSGARVGRPPRVQYCAPIGTHPRMPELVLRHAVESAASAHVEPDRCALVVIGHGTPRSATSADSVLEVTRRVAGSGVFHHVVCGFLDETPTIDSVVATVRTREVILVPYFLAEGWHTRITIPQVLGLTGSSTQRGDQTLRYTPPIGTRPELDELVLDLATFAGARVP